MTQQWKSFEDKFEQALIETGYRYERELIAKRMGVARAGTGRFDFLVFLPSGVHACIELKSLDKGSYLTVPRPAVKDPKIAMHQIVNLTKAQMDGKIAGLLIEYRGEASTMWLDIDSYYSALAHEMATRGTVATLSYIMCCKYGKRVDDMIEFLRRLNSGSYRQDNTGTTTDDTRTDKRVGEGDGSKPSNAKRKSKDTI